MPEKNGNTDICHSFQALLPFFLQTGCKNLAIIYIICVYLPVRRSNFCLEIVMLFSLLQVSIQDVELVSGACKIPAVGGFKQSAADRVTEYAD